MRQETIQEYLNRGGKITMIGDADIYTNFDCEILKFASSEQTERSRNVKSRKAHLREYLDGVEPEPKIPDLPLRQLEKRRTRERVINYLTKNPGVTVKKAMKDLRLSNTVIYRYKKEVEWAG